MPFIIAIDGTSASGKGTLTKALAKILNFDYLDTGALYRILAYHINENHIDINNTPAILKLIKIIDFKQGDSLPIYNEEIGQIASKIATNQQVREALNNIQRDFPVGKIGAILDGRDIGTVIFPKANCKLFITADVKVRAERRYKQLQLEGKNIIFDQILKDLQERGERDRNRTISPTVPAHDAIIIDTSNMDADTVLENALKYILKILKE